MSRPFPTLNSGVWLMLFLVVLIRASARSRGWAYGKLRVLLT